MDSGDSSGSMQSSSGGDEEYDSGGESVSAFLNSNPDPPHPGDSAVPGLPRRLHHQLQLPHMAMFDHLSSCFDPLTTRSASLAAASTPITNLDVLAWSKRPRLEHICNDLGGFDLEPTQLQPILGYINNQGQDRGGGAGTAGFPVPSEPEDPSQLGSISGSAPDEQAPAVAASSNNINNGATGSNTLVRNPKKRSRASRRAPTSIMTTDTTNFRAMVQEFTGIPAPPFQRSRLDLLGSGLGSPSYLLRPFARKLHPPTVVPYFAALGSTVAGNSIANTDLGLLNQNMPNPVLDLQSLFQAAQKYPIAGSSIFHPKTLGSSDIPGSELGLSHGDVRTQLRPGLPNMDPSNRTLSENRDNNNNNDDNPPPNWHGDGARPNNDGSSQVTLKPLDGNSGLIGNGDRWPGSIGSRGEGMVESWIYSSD